MPHTTLYITVMVTYMSLHCFVAKCLIQMFKNMHGLKSTCIFLFDYLFTQFKMKQCLLGISRLNQVDRLHGCWKLEVY